MNQQNVNEEAIVSKVLPAALTRFTTDAQHLTRLTNPDLPDLASTKREPFQSDSTCLMSSLRHPPLWQQPSGAASQTLKGGCFSSLLSTELYLMLLNQSWHRGNYLIRHRLIPAFGSAATSDPRTNDRKAFQEHRKSD